MSDEDDELDPMDFIKTEAERRKPGRPRKEVSVAVAEPMPTPVAEPVSPALLEMMERLFERLDRNANDTTAYETLQKILEQNASALQQTFKRENALHPDVSYFNPDGETNAATRRPALKRQLWLLNVPFPEEQLTKEERLLVNSFEHSMETTDGKKKAVVMKDASGREILMIVVPFNGSFDDLRYLGGIGSLMREIRDGKRQQTQGTVNDDVAVLKAQVAELMAALKAKDAVPA